MVDNAPNSILLSLRRIIQDFSSKNSFEEAIATFVEEIRTSTDVDCCSLYLLDARRTYLRLAATDGLSKSSIGKANLRVGEGLVGLVAQKQELINLADAPSHPNFKFLPDVGEDEFLSFLGVPVINQGELLGVLVIQSREDRQFDEQEESFLITLSAQIASTVSLNRNKLYQENSSTRFKGQVGTGGIAIAQAAVWKPPVTFNNLQIMYTDERTIQSELFHQTIFQLQTEMDKKVLSMRENSQSRAESGYIHGYGSLLDDSELIDEVDRAILDQGYVAASAIKVVVQSRLERDQQILSKDKMRDLIDFAHILIYRLTHIYSSNDEIQQNEILVVRTLPAATVADLPRDKVEGFICVDSATSSHTAILAQDLGIPAVIGVQLSLDEIDGHTVIIDGQNAEVIVDPSPSVIDEYNQLISQGQERRDLFESEKKEKGISIDGRRITIQLNAGLNHEAKDLTDETDGIGLYRTEIAFMLNSSLPTEEQQIGWYSNLLSQFKGRPVCMRTLDVGGDKGLPYLPIEEQNPALGWRGIRVCIDQPDILKTQLRAMMYAHMEHGNLEVMVPMIARLEEVLIVKRLLNEAISEVEQENNTIISRPRFGVMIEIPCLAYVLDDIAQEVDFFSIGSNDLIQYLFAVDRNNPKVSKFFDPFNPAAVRCLKYLVDKSKILKKPLSICGELAGSSLGSLLLMSLGFEHLSMNYSQMARVKYIVRHTNISELIKVGTQALTLSNSDQIKALYEDFARVNGLSRVIELSDNIRS